MSEEDREIDTKFLYRPSDSPASHSGDASRPCRSHRTSLLAHVFAVSSSSSPLQAFAASSVNSVAFGRPSDLNGLVRSNPSADQLGRPLGGQLSDRAPLVTTENENFKWQTMSVDLFEDYQ